MKSEPSATRPLRIFIVENHPDTLESFTLYLEGLGHTVLSAISLAEAREKLPAADCDVLLCDIGLPDGSGCDLLKRVELPRPIFAVAMSGFNRAADRSQSAAAGFRHHLLKPLKPAQIVAVLEEATEELSAAS